MVENKKSPLRYWWVLPAIVGGLWAAGKAKKLVKKVQKTAKKEKVDLSEYQKAFEERLKKYEESKFQPLDPEALKQENIFEDIDLTKDVLPAADYAKEQFQQQQANIMAGMRGAAGAAGIAGLAQALSVQAKQQARETGVSLGQQLAQGRRLALQETARQRQQERQVALANMEGARQFEIDKMSTLIGVSGARIAGARGAIASRQSMYGQVAGGVGQVAGAAIGAINWSDRKLKKDIDLMGKSPSGLNIYNFKYINTEFGEGTYQGVMADEIPSYAVMQHPNGYDMVDYSKIDVNFKRI